jgi:hypothetical protein
LSAYESWKVEEVEKVAEARDVDERHRDVQRAFYVGWI